VPQATNLLNNVSAVVLREITAQRPLERELNGTAMETVGSETLDNVDCDVVHVVLNTDGGEVEWALGQADHLPRRVRRFIATPVGKTTMTTSLSGLNLKPTIAADLFTIQRPEGFGDMAASAPAQRGQALLPLGSDAPDWSLKTPEGQEVTLKGLRGKIVLMDFWATWCGPCQMAMPGVDRLYKRYSGKPVAIYGIDCWERNPNADPAGFMKKKGISYPILLEGNAAASAYKAGGIPTFYLISPEGKVLLAFSGYSADGERQIEALINQELKKLGIEPPAPEPTAETQPSSAPAAMPPAPPKT
jgi:thiol-disulfide isomerase/thioredoxin